jgi:hypothetical protein
VRRPGVLAGQRHSSQAGRTSQVGRTAASINRPIARTAGPHQQRTGQPTTPFRRLDAATHSAAHPPSHRPNHSPVCHPSVVTHTCGLLNRWEQHVFTLLIINGRFREPTPPLPRSPNMTLLARPFPPVPGAPGVRADPVPHRVRAIATRNRPVAPREGTAAERRPSLTVSSTDTSPVSGAVAPADPGLTCCAISRPGSAGRRRQAHDPGAGRALIFPLLITSR